MLLKQRLYGGKMFISNSRFTKKLVVFTLTTVCIIFTSAIILGYIFGNEKPELGGVIIVALYDIGWILSYLFYVSKK